MTVLLPELLRSRLFVVFRQYGKTLYGDDVSCRFLFVSLSSIPEIMMIGLLLPFV